MNLIDGVNINEALTITVFSMGLVFLSLLAISFILDGFRVIFYKKPSQKKMNEVKQEPVKTVVATKAEPEQDDEELVAVITAAIAASISRPASEIVVRNIMRVSQSTPVWGKVGRQEQFNLK